MRNHTSLCGLTLCIEYAPIVGKAREHAFAPRVISDFLHLNLVDELLPLIWKVIVYHRPASPCANYMCYKG